MIFKKVLTLLDYETDARQWLSFKNKQFNE